MLDVLIGSSGKQTDAKGSLKMSDRIDRPVKSIMKAVSWRIVGTIDTMLISYFITGKITVAISIGSVEVISKTFLYYFHERLWAHIHRIKLNIFNRQNGKNIRIRRAEKPIKRKIDRRIPENSCVTISG